MDNLDELVRALAAPNWRVRRNAVEALGKIEDARAVEPLIGALRDTDEDVQQEAEAALGKIGAPAVEPLIGALSDRDRHVRERAAGALGEIGDARAVEPLIRALGEGYLETLGGFGGPYALVSIRAAMALEKIGAPAVEPLDR